MEHRLPDEAALAAALAEDVARRLRDAIASRGRAVLAVSGGKSPIPLFQALREQALDWAQVVVTLVDERWVGPDHADSNAALVRRHLLAGRAAAARFLPLLPPDAAGWLAGLTDAGHLPDPAALSPWARLADAALQPLWPADVVLLGMGLDGHTASLFPSAQGLDEALRPDAALVAAVLPPHAPHPRLSLTLPALLSARHVALQISGPAKQAVYALARRQASPDRPVSLVLHQDRCPVEVWIGA